MTDLLFQNIFSPAILFFALGSIAGILKSDLNVPEALGRYLGIYLMMSIGFKGGVSVSNIDHFDNRIFALIFFSIIVSGAIPFIAFKILRYTSTLSTPNASALAAHYGSVSIVTFATAVNFLQASNISYSGYMVSILAIMEAPAIITGLYIAHRYAPETNCHKKEEKKLSKEIFANGAVLLIMGSLIIGVITGQNGMNKLSGFLSQPFQGVLCLFLLDMGLIVTRHFEKLRKISLSVILFGIYMPLISALISYFISNFLELSHGDSFLFMILCASSSYIAVPAAMRLALPEADASIYMPISLGITFTINITAGLPLYFYLSNL